MFCLREFSAYLLCFESLTYLHNSEDATGADSAHARDKEGQRDLQDRVVPFLLLVLLVFLYNR